MSTVIVFAVLLFLSYENMNNKFVDENIDVTESTCEQLSSDLGDAFVSGDIADPLKMVDYIIHSRMFADVANIYIVDSNGAIAFECTEHLEYELATFQTGDSVYLEDENVNECLNEVTYSYQQKTKLVNHSNDVEVISINKIDNSDYYCIVYRDADTSLVKSEYLSVIFIPTLIALVVALILLVGFVGISMRPVNEMSRVISRVADGDYSARVSGKFANPNELSVLTVSSDMTEMASTLNNMLEILENQENDRSVFISSIAHDIRTPLTSINGFVTAMLDGTIPPENQEKYLVMIKNEADRIRRLVTSMTEASSLSHVDPELMEEFDLKDVFDDVIPNLEPQKVKKDITIETVLNTDGNNIVYGEAQQLCRVIVNIISNAIKFTPYGGTIRVTAERKEDDNVMKVSVEDSGAGVEDDKKARIFESFYKADPSRKQEGFGLGLYICKQILVGHDQSIRVEDSEDLGGAKFVFTLPLPPKDSKK